MQLSETKKKKKITGSLPGVNITVGTGCPALNAKQFNKDAVVTSTDSNTPIDGIAGGEANMSAGGDGGCAGGGCAESLDHVTSLTEKRETKRYYIRPQNIFCANKADVLKGLITVANSDENCTVYSLKNLEDHDDVHKLTNHDIIYYYDDNVLYDKNHVLVMDYDLFIKHEEERKKINKDPVALTKTDYDQNYEDRMTKETVVESSGENMTFKNNEICNEAMHTTDNPVPFNAFKLAIERGEAVDLGYNREDADVVYVRDGHESGAYASTIFVAGKDNDGYYIEHTITGDDGVVGDCDADYYESFDELVAAIRAKDWSTGEIAIELPEIVDTDNPFDLTFESYDVFGHRLTEAKHEDKEEFCCICGEPIEGYGNNAAPYKDGKCCDPCNYKFVIPARLNLVVSTEQNDAEEEE